MQTAGQFDARVTAENITAPAGPVSARSLNGVATLGVQQGHEVLIKASGPQAAQALAALRDLADRNFDEPAEPGPAVPEVVTTGTPAPAAVVAPGVRPADGTILRGIPGSPGLAAGDAVHLRRSTVQVPREPAADPGAELARLDAALEATRP